MGAAQSKKQVAWPRCRWCREYIEPVPGSPIPTTRPAASWSHVTTGTITCTGRTNSAEPVPEIHEEPFMLAVWQFVKRYRTLRREFRELSQSRASAVRRMQDYQKLVDELADAYNQGGDDELQMAAKALVDYRKSTQAAGWR